MKKKKKKKKNKKKKKEKDQKKQEDKDEHLRGAELRVLLPPLWPGVHGQVQLAEAPGDLPHRPGEEQAGRTVDQVQAVRGHLLQQTGVAVPQPSPYSQ